MMFSRRATTVGAAAVAGAALLTGCGVDGEGRDSAAKAGRILLGGLAFLPGTAEKNHAKANTGDWAVKPGNPATGAAAEAAKKWVQLSAVDPGSQNSNVINGAGLTLYRFDKDQASPSKSTCDPKCAATWPPVLINPEGRVFIDGIKKSDVGLVKRADGTFQLTLSGQPVYRFIRDIQPGDVNGYGVDGTWFTVTPDGAAGLDEIDRNAASPAAPGPAAS